MSGAIVISYVVDAALEPKALADFWSRAWGGAAPENYERVLARSLAHVAAFDGARLIGFVNVAWDGGVHAFILDTAVDPEYRQQGIARALVGQAAETARARGAHWLHVDYEPHLEGFYRGCGFRPTKAGLIRLA